MVDTPHHGSKADAVMVHAPTQMHMRSERKQWSIPLSSSREPVCSISSCDTCRSEGNKVISKLILCPTKEHLLESLPTFCFCVVLLVISSRLERSAGEGDVFFLKHCL